MERVERKIERNRERGEIGRKRKIENEGGGRDDGRYKAYNIYLIH
jgi:hypothetical protein